MGTQAYADIGLRSSCAVSHPMADDDSLVLYGETLWISPYVLSSYVALREKRVAFRVEEVDLLHLAHRTGPYRDASITAKVPALRHGDFWLGESSAIAEYLEELFPERHPSLLPADRQARARARQLMAWLRSDLGALRDERPTTTIFIEPATRPLSPAGLEDAEKLVRVASRLLGGGAFLFGEFALVDAELALMLQRLAKNGDALPDALRRYADAQWARPSVAEFVQHPRPDRVPDDYWRTPWNLPPSGEPRKP
jgi:glutathione S-transferase